MEKFQIPEELLLPETEGKHLEDPGLNEAEKIAALLELASDNDLEGFRETIDADKGLISKSGSWYGRQSGSRQMILVQRTPVMIASMHGSVEVLKYILSFVPTGDIDIDQCCEPDGFSALHCAVSGGSPRAVEVVSLLIQSGADTNITDKEKKRPLEVISPKILNLKEMLENLLLCPSSAFSIKTLESVTSVGSTLSSGSASDPPVDSGPSSPTPSPANFQGDNVQVECTVNAGKEYTTDPSLPDIKNAMYTTDEFRMFSFKIRPCSRAYSHDWTECPFVHPGENARRRDPRRFHYSCVPCPDFRKGSCKRGDACEYAHGVFECWLHPAQYRTRLCKDGINCSRRVCFFAHLPEELRPLYTPNGCSPSSRASVPIDMRSLAISPDLPPPSPSSVLMMSPFSSPPGGSPSSNLTPPMSPSHPSNPSLSHPNIWSNSSNVKVPPTLQLSSGPHTSRLRAGLHARDMIFQEEMDSLFSMQMSKFEDSGLTSDPVLNPCQSRLLPPNSVGVDPSHIRNLSNHSLNSVQEFGDELPPEVLVSPRSSLRASRSPISSPVHPHLEHTHPSHIRQRSDQLLLPNLDFSLPISGPNAFPGGCDIPNQSGMVQNQQSAVVAALNARRSLSSRSSSWREREPSPSLLSSNFLHSLPSMASNHSMAGKTEWGGNHKDVTNVFINGFRQEGSQNGLESEPDVSWVQSLVKDGVSDLKPTISSSPPYSSIPASYPMDPSVDLMRMSLNHCASVWSSDCS